MTNKRYYDPRTRKSDKEKEARKQRKLLQQLGICLLILAAVLFSRQVFPNRTQALAQEIKNTVTSTVDLRGAVEKLGRSVSEGEGLVPSVYEFCVSVFGAQPVKTMPSDDAAETEEEPAAENGAVLE